MNQAMTGVVIAAVLAACWLLGRPRPKLLSSTDTAAVAALNRGQMELVLADPAAAATLPSAPVDRQKTRASPCCPIPIKSLA